MFIYIYNNLGSSLLFDNDKTLTIPDNNNKSYVMPTIEDIYNSGIIIIYIKIIYTNIILYFLF